MINKNLVWFLLSFFFWLIIQKILFNIGFETNIDWQTQCWMRLLDCLAKASWNTYINTNKRAKLAIITQTSSQKNIVIEGHQSYWNSLNHTHFNARALRSVAPDNGTLIKWCRRQHVICIKTSKQTSFEQLIDLDYFTLVQTSNSPELIFSCSNSLFISAILPWPIYSRSNS